MAQIKKSALTYASLALALTLPCLALAADPQPAQPQTPQQPAAAAAPESAASRLSSTTGQNREQLARRIESVGHLLDTSSAARQIEASQDPQALAGRDEARALYNKARETFDAGDLQSAARQLTEATTLLFKAVRFAAPADVTRKKLENDFKMRRESVQALLGAFKRVSSEKSATKGAAETVNGIERSVAAADKLAESGKFEEGRTELDQAYIAVKSAVRTLRQGDTLVRSLNFANKEEEYHYEIDRNDTHQMLIKVLVDEKRAESPDLDRKVSEFVQKAKELRTAAESSATAKDFSGAIKQLENSTAELVKAIRNAGIYIPG